MHADVSAYIASLVTCGAYLPLCLLHHTMYDETPLKLRADFSATSGGDPPDIQGICRHQCLQLRVEKGFSRTC